MMMPQRLQKPLLGLGMLSYPQNQDKIRKHSNVFKSYGKNVKKGE